MTFSTVMLSMIKDLINLTLEIFQKFQKSFKNAKFKGWKLERPYSFEMVSQQEFNNDQIEYFWNVDQNAGNDRNGSSLFIYLVLWSKCFVFVNFHLDIEFTLFGNELKGSLNWFDSKVKWNTVFIFVSTFPCENFSWFITARCMPVNTVVVDIIWICLLKLIVFGDFSELSLRLTFCFVDNLGVTHCEWRENDKSVRFCVAIICRDTVCSIFRHCQLINISEVHSFFFEIIFVDSNIDFWSTTCDFDIFFHRICWILF